MLVNLYIIIIIVIKTSRLEQVVFINCFRNPTSTCATENWRKPNSGKQPVVDCTLEPIQRSDVERSVGKVIKQSNLGRQERPCKLWHSTPWYFKLQWPQLGILNLIFRIFSTSRWKLAEQTVIRFRIKFVQHTSRATRRRWHNDNKLWSGQSLARRSMKETFSSWPPHWRTIHKDWENKCKKEMKEYGGVHKYTFQ